MRSGLTAARIFADRLDNRVHLSYTLTMNTNLEIKVAARNLVNTLVNENVATIRAALAHFVGQKVILATGGFSAKFAKAIAVLNLPCTPAAHIWITSSGGYTVAAKFRVSVTDGSTFYAEETVYLFDIEHGTLKVCAGYDARKPLRTDFDAAQIRVARDVVKQKRSELQAAENALCFFGEHDNH